MCGIVGYVGKRQATEVLLNGLERLEYRGYDSAGVAVYDEEKQEIQVTKARGRLSILRNLTHDGATMPGHVGIGHTRWATHGEPSDVNAHPHLNEDGSVALVHNGIIENYLKLKKKLTAKGEHFLSDTDTEVAAHLIGDYDEGDPLSAIIHTIHRVEGSYAFGILFKAQPDRIYAVRKDAPLIIGLGKEENFIASDVPAILKYTRDVIYIDNGEIAEIRPDGVTIYDVDKNVVEKEVHHIDWDSDAAEKGGYPHFMLKEMNEQPKTVRDTLGAYLKGKRVDLSSIGLTDDRIKKTERIHFVACGSAYHTGVTASYVFEQMARIPVEADLASEFRYRDPILGKNDLVILVSQSGETADTLAALRLAKKEGVPTLAIINVEGSSIAREADLVMYTKAGPEIAVATTKAYTGQLVAEYLLAIKFAEVRGEITERDEETYIEELKRLPVQIELLLSNTAPIQKFANRYVSARDIFFIGRNIDYAIAMEASLKLKEISYIHSEAYAAGELKHGTISLIEDGTPVAAVVTQDRLFGKTLSNIVEVRARGAFVLAVTNEGNTEIEKAADYVIYIPATDPYFTNSLAIIPLQLLAYYVAVGRGCDVDKPKNLAKSVTVE